MLLLHRFTKCLQIVEQQILLQKENSLKRCTETTWAKSHGWNCAVKKVTLLGSTLTLRWCAAKLVSVFFHFCFCGCVLQFTLCLCTVAPFWTAKFFYSNWVTLHLCLFVCVRVCVRFIGAAEAQVASTRSTWHVVPRPWHHWCWARCLVSFSSALISSDFCNLTRGASVSVYVTVVWCDAFLWKSKKWHDILCWWWRGRRCQRSYATVVSLLVA